jgi:Tfp pilus assembly protein PilN
MITINLRPGLKRKTAGSPFAGLKQKAAAVGARVKDPLLLVAVVCWVAVLGFLGFTWFSNTRQLHALEPRLEQAQAEHRRFDSFIRQKRRQEAIRDSLLRQIGVIRNVDGDRYVWAHILDETAKALPPYTWIVDMGMVAGQAAPAPADPAADSAAVDTVRPPLEFQITGRTVDIQAYTRFLRQLEASPWVTGVTPTSAQTVVENERPVTAFTIRAKFEQADSAYIRTVPLSQSVR